MTRNLYSPIRGFGPLKNNLLPTAPYKAEDILIITDGRCSSTCTTFVNLMTQSGVVRVLFFGDRPELSPMQAMGGVRGSQSLGFQDIVGLVGATEQLATAISNEAYRLNDTSHGPYGIPGLTHEMVTAINESVPKNATLWPLKLTGTWGESQLP